MLENILIAYDGSESASRAFQLAVQMAKRFSARLTAISVVQFPEPATMVETKALLESGSERCEKDFASIRDDARGEGIELHTHVAAGHAAEQVVHYAGQIKADLIVLGHRGKGLVERWLVGSVSKRVLSYAPCSVLVVR